jgi:hypothetical protein
MEKQGLELDSFTQKVAVEYTVDHALLSIASHNLEQKVSMTGKMHQNEPQNTKIQKVINLATEGPCTICGYNSFQYVSPICNFFL